MSMSMKAFAISQYAAAVAGRDEVGGDSNRYLTVLMHNQQTMISGRQQLEVLRDAIDYALGDHKDGDDPA